MAYVIIWLLVFAFSIYGEDADPRDYIILSGVVALVIGSVYYALKTLIQFIF